MTVPKDPVGCTPPNPWGHDDALRKEVARSLDPKDVLHKSCAVKSESKLHLPGSFRDGLVSLSLTRRNSGTIVVRSM